MHNPASRWLRRIAALILAAAMPAMAQLPFVLGEPVQALKEARAPAQLRIEQRVEAQPQLRAQAILAPVAAEEIEALRRANGALAPRANLKRTLIGVVRRAEATPALPSASQLAWLPVAGGFATQMAITSPQAAALRVSIDLAAVPGDVQMVFFGSGAPSHLVGPVLVSDIADRTSPWWSPVTEGETQTVEFFVPGDADPRSLALRAVAVSHLFAGPSSRFEKTVQDIGTAGSCNVDVACSSLQSSTAFRNASASTAEMVFTDGPFIGECSGTLLNDTDGSTQVPWFLSGNHCFDNEKAPYKTPGQMQVVANTLDTLWFFEASSCGSGVPSASYRELPTGATFLYGDPNSDGLFLRLNGTPPQGAWFSGWDSNPIAAGAGVVAIHHPMGDLKKVSQGSVLGFLTPFGIAPSTSPSGNFIQIRWSSGTTEPGSSGGGLFTNSGSQYVLRGGLLGGGASCTSLTSPDFFSRFDRVYPSIASYLAPANAPAFDYTDLWWNPNESGWGLSITQHASHAIFAAWFTYGSDGKSTWYTLPSGTWTSSSTYTGPLYTAAGPAASGAFDPSQVVPTQVGTATLAFSDANNGTLTYSINGASGSKSITRQPF